MPRTSIGVPWEQQELEADLRSRYGGYMTHTQIAQELGISRPTAIAWTKTMPVYKLGRRPRYSVRDIAKLIYQSKEAPT